MHLDAVLRTICAQPWVPELCLVSPEKLADNYLIDKEVYTPPLSLSLSVTLCSNIDPPPSLN
jgi:hypothetical protein